MLNEKKIEEIRSRVQSSKLLSDHEKADWLNLIELMNDKQLADLEDILGSKPPEETETSSVHMAAPPLAKPLPTPPPPMPAPEPVAPPVHMAAPPKPAVAPAPAPPFQKPASEPALPPLAPLSHIANVPSDVALTHSLPTHVNSPEQIPAPTPAPEAKHTLQKSTQQFTIEQPDDLKGLNIATLRNYDWHSIAEQVKKAIGEVGYFQILQIIESSALYEAYIQSGKMRLQGDPSEVTQEEFEFMTDLLSSMRFNRW
jgi:hypothetical protein